MQAELKPSTDAPADILVIEVDGSQLPIHGDEPWKEAKVGLTYRQDAKTHRPVKSSARYVAVVGGQSEFAPLLEEALHIEDIDSAHTALPRRNPAFVANLVHGPSGDRVECPRMAKREHAIVIGGSMAGLLTAEVLSRHFQRVTLFERDSVEDTPQSRKGQPQTQHLHGLLAQGLVIIEDLFQGLSQELIAAGAVSGDMAEVMHWYQYGGHRLSFRSNLRNMTMTRPLLEQLVRRRVVANPKVTLAAQHDVVELLTTPDKARVVGVRVAAREPAEAKQTVEADWVVDTAGRGSRLPKWLEALGYVRPSETEVAAGIGYSTQQFKRDPAHTQLEMISPTAPAEKRGAFLFPVEGERWILTAGGYVGDHPPDDAAGLMNFVRGLPRPEIFDIVSRAQPLSDVVTYKFPVSLRRHYEKLERFPDGLLALGDALASLNPIYGQGMTLAAMEARTLGHCFGETPEPKPMWRKYFRAVAKIIDIPWSLAVVEDFRYPETKGEKPPLTDLINNYVAKVHKATQHDAVVYGQFLRVVNLMAPPTSLFSPGILVRVLARG